MRARELSLTTKKAIVRMKEKKKSIQALAERFCIPKSTEGNVPKKKLPTGIQRK